MVLPAAPGWADGPVEVTGALRITAPGEALVGVDGTRYHGTIELAADGQLVNELPLERYVEGVAEMPARWHPEALRAQAVAARTYVWRSADRGAHEGVDICSTTACQVFRGAEVVLDGGEAWARAVADTAGQVLVTADGAPILARYFSTSGGRTYANAEAFPSTGHHDYLVAIDDPYDEVSPYHRWQVRFTRAEFDEVLSRGERLSAAVPVASVTRTGAVDDLSAGFVVTGGNGARVEVGAVELRDFLNLVAPARFPDRFPGPRADGLRRLPSTVPSSRFTATVGAEEVVLDGRGWGHGVGLGQYGARGRAEAGADHTEILAAYYGGLQPSVAAGVPERIRVGLGSADTRTFAGEDVLTVTDAAGEVILEGVLGPWTATRTAAGWRLTPPVTDALPLEVTPTTVVAALSRPGDAVTVEAEVNRHALLRLEVVAVPDGTTVRTRHLGVADPGLHAATWRFEDDAGQPVPPGRYRLALMGRDGRGGASGSGVEVEVAQDGGTGEVTGPDGAAGPNDTSPGRWGTRTLPLVVVILLAATVAATFLIRRPHPARSRP